MKWFRHNTDSHTNLKLREIFSDFGIEGYAVYWICLELVGQQGTNYRLNGSKSWPKALKDITKLPQEKIDKMLQSFSRLNLICCKSLEKGDLYIPKMKEYSDEYSKRIRRVSEQSIPTLHNNTLHNIRIHYIKLKGWQESDLISDDYARIHHAIKNLLIKTKGDEKQAIKAIDWVSQQKYCDWTMETVVKKYGNFLNPERKDELGIPLKYYKKE